MKTLIARGEPLDILTFLAAVNRVADLLGLRGDDDPVAVRRSKAVGILGQPDRALALLTAHRDDPDIPPGPVEPRPHGWRRPRPTGEHDPDEHDTDEGDEDEDSDEGEGRRAGGDGEGAGGVERREPGDSDEPRDEAEPDRLDEQPGSRSLDLTPPDHSTGVRTTSDQVTKDRAGTVSVRVQLHVHLTDIALAGTDPSAVCRVKGVGPLTARTVRGWLARSDVQVTVRPVAVPGHAIPVDAYAIPRSTREAVLLRNPASAFPWSACVDPHTLQLDHVVPYRPIRSGGPPGQTDPARLAPLAGSEHQDKTHRHWQERTPAPGVHLWRSPHGWVYVITNQGTFPLGTSQTAQRIWHAVAPYEPSPSRAGPRARGTRTTLLGARSLAAAAHASSC